jgi:mannosyltransferase OCH1-like enzyme
MIGAAKADLWRLLILWEYGGVYTDIDNAPEPMFKNGTTISDDDDSFFVVERIGALSQYFMAASPKRPLIHIATTETRKRLLEVTNIGTQNVGWVSGPEAMRHKV